VIAKHLDSTVVRQNSGLRSTFYSMTASASSHSVAALELESLRSHSAPDLKR
jgi:hypothetical protein